MKDDERHRKRGVRKTMPYRVLVVDDSIFMRRIISDLIAENRNFQVADTAKNGKEAVEKTLLLKPDLVTMDVEMPEMNGLEALRQIMQSYPVPVIMLSSLTGEGAHETIRALELGAFDFVQKPSGSISFDLYKVKSLLHEKMEAAVQAKDKWNRLYRRPFILPPPPPATPAQNGIMSKTGKTSATFGSLVAIGTSTGGPRALQQVLSRLPGSFPAPILIVQHMPPNFTKSLAQRLHSASQIRVVEAEDGQPVLSGTAYIAPGGWHMRMSRLEGNRYRIRLSREAPKNGHRPSVDVLFDSLLAFHELKRHIVLMTGMGSDGAQGMFALRKAGAVTTIAESEESCVVYGMPRAAVELGAATNILPLEQIAGKLIEAVGDGR